MDRLFVWLQHLLPQHFLSALMHAITRIRTPWFKNAFISTFIRLFKVNMDEAVEPDATRYETFNAFFTRALRDDARPIKAADHGLICPVDGTVSQAGIIQDSELFQAKGKSFNLTALLGDEARAAKFEGGHFTTIYLSPRDYHRIHFPIGARLTDMVHIPGQLFSVNPVTTSHIDGLFAKNERVCAFFDTDAGPMAMILVGAIFVSSIETVWQGVVTPPRHNQLRVWHYTDRETPLQFNQGDELGRFNMGSTIILLFGKDQVQWADNLIADQSVQLGQTIGTIQNH